MEVKITRSINYMGNYTFDDWYDFELVLIKIQADIKENRN